METHIEVKVLDGDDGFADERGKSFESETALGKGTRGQIASYAVAQLASQFRTHLFTVLVFRAHARLVRWDRSGAIVTNRFGLRDAGLPLADFFWRFHHATSDTRGTDISVSPPSEQDETLAREYLKNAVEPLVQFEVSSYLDGSISHYIGAKPKAQRTSSPIGRATRGFVVYGLQEKEVVYLKDTWRIDEPDIIHEGKIYAQLHEVQVKNIAPCLRAGDVRKHQTQTHTQRFNRSGWNRNVGKDPRPHRHYRLVLGVVGRELTSFESSWELVNAMKGALLGTQIRVLLSDDHNLTLVSTCIVMAAHKEA